MENSFTKVPFVIAEAFAQSAFQYGRKTVLFAKRYDNPYNENAYLALVELDSPAALRYILVLVDIQHNNHKITLHNKELPGLYTFKNALIKFSEHLQQEEHDLAKVN